MSDTTLANRTHHHPHTIFLKDYKIPDFLIDEIDLHVDLNDDVTLVVSHLRVRHNRASKETGRQLRLHGEELQLVAIKLNNEALPAAQYKIADNYLVIDHLPDHFTLEITTKIYPQKNTALSGLYRSENTYCTQCEAEGFRRITYYLDQPDILARFTTTIVADAKKYPILLSNGNLISSRLLDNGKHLVKWEDPFKKPSYLFALVAGDFDLLEDTFTTQSGRQVALKIYVEKGYRDQAHHAMYAVKQAMRWDEVAYGREYDLDVYMIVAISDFNMGAMENKGLNIFNTKYVMAKPDVATDDDYINIMSVVAHEYFHNWTGNRVTCRDWFQLSLKEGLTIFRDQSFSEDTLSRPVMRIRDVMDLREAQFPEDAGPLAHPVRPDSYIEINNFYTSTIYNKGAEVLRMMKTIVNDEMFRKGMDLYFARHDGQAVTIEDYVQAMEDVSGVDLKQFRLWYSQAGTPVVSVKDEYDAKNNVYRLTLTQLCPPTPGQPNKVPLHIPVRVGLLAADGAQLGDERILQLKQTTQVFEFTEVLSKPVPSLLRHFSAPVKLRYDYSDHDLILLATHDTDAFNRWEAVQKLALNTILNLVADYQKGKALNLSGDVVDMYRSLLQQPSDDHFFVAEMLSLPSENYIGEQMVTVDVDAIHAVREFMLSQLATQLEASFLSVYHALHTTKPYEFTMQAVGQRQLKNKCLVYLSYLPQHLELVLKQFDAANQHNMTDTMPALSVLANTDSPAREKTLATFYTTWKQDALVMDKWFAVQATSKLNGTLDRVKKLLQHEAFDIKNPNKVYALIGGFGHRNLINFHAKDGAGYVFLREIVQQLDKLNPQVAARMVKPLTTWDRYDKERQQLMREQLELLSQDKKLSTDVYELVNKSLQ